jgi:hypothetical protein
MLPPDLGDNANVFDSIKDQFTVVAKSSNAVLYKRNPGAPDICTAVAAGATTPPTTTAP